MQIPRRRIVLRLDYRAAAALFYFQRAADGSFTFGLTWLLVIDSNSSMPGPDETEIQRAIQLHTAGRLAEAEQAYRKILAIHPNEPKCTHMLGLALFQRGDVVSSEPLLLRSLQLAPDIADFHENFAILCRATGKREQAVEHLRRAIELNPSRASAHTNLGLVLEDLHRHEDAVNAYRAALECDPAFSLARKHLARLLWKLQRADQAMELWRQAIQIDPADVESRINLACGLILKGMENHAIPILQEAIHIQPQLAAGWSNLGWAMHRLSRLEESLACYLKASQIDPSNAQILTHLGHVYFETSQIDSAIEACCKAIEIAPREITAMTLLSCAYQSQGDFKKAAECARRVLTVHPENAEARSNLLLALHYDPDVRREDLHREHLEYGRVQEGESGGKHFEYLNIRDPDRRLRIAYVSPHFRYHAVASFVEPFLRSHDRSRFHISCYCDVSKGAQDDLTQRLRQHVDVWHDVATLTNNQLADLIHANSEDILVDLTGHIGGNRLPAFVRKPAPIQMTYLGYQNTTGLHAMDYRITDEVADPPGEGDSFYTEKLLRLPCFFCYQPSEFAPEVRPLPAAESGRITFGCLNNMPKFNPQVLELWARLLDRVPNSRLMLPVASPGSSTSRLTDMLAACGVSPQRFTLVPRSVPSEYLKLYDGIDIALDPFPFSGHTTTCDALWMGVPVITMPGESYASRMSTSVLTHLGLPELIASGSEDYLRIAADLANDRERLTGLRASLRATMSKSIITDAVKFTKNLEFTYRQAWHRWCESQRQ